jgi:hypothetical protein
MDDRSVDHLTETRSAPTPALRPGRSSARRPLAAVVLLAGLTACGEDPVAVPRDEIPSAFGTRSVPGPDWTLVERASFSFELPPGFVEAGMQVSRTSGRYLRPRDGTTLAFDLGPEPRGIRPPADATGVRQAWTILGGRRVHLAKWTVDGTSVVRGWWPRVGERDGVVQGLWVGGTFTQVSGRDDLLAAIRSVSFP